MNLFRAVRQRVDATLGFETRLLEGAEETARFVLDKSTGAVLLLTARNDWSDRVDGLDAGADDYVAKPSPRPGPTTISGTVEKQYSG